MKISLDSVKQDFARRNPMPRRRQFDEGILMVQLPTECFFQTNQRVWLPTWDFLLCSMVTLKCIVF